MLENKQPHDIFIGNSILDRLDPDVMSRMLPQRKHVIMRFSGSLPNLWYRVIKNDIASLEKKPEQVVFLLQSDEIVHPIGVPYNSQTNLVLRKSVVNEPIIWQEILSSEPVKSLRYMILSLYKVQGLRADIEWYLTNIAMFLSNPSYRDAFFSNGAINHIRIRSANLDAVNDRFIKKRKSVINKIIPQKNSAVRYTDFATALPKSYLPKIVSLLKASGITPVFIYVKVLDNRNNDGKLDVYEQKFRDDLGAYLEKHGAVYIDKSFNPTITEDMFADRGHVSIDYTEFYTEDFIYKLGYNCSGDAPVAPKDVMASVNVPNKKDLPTCENWKFANKTASQNTLLQ
ncbi:MAG: hypothetical protein HQL69_09195 [Magnetococcales bacterium]|nr:hypothetical protein [Magnetococcales bacterium]